MAKVESVSITQIGLAALTLVVCGSCIHFFHVHSLHSEQHHIDRTMHHPAAKAHPVTDQIHEENSEDRQLTASSEDPEAASSGDSEPQVAPETQVPEVPLKILVQRWIDCKQSGVCTFGGSPDFEVVVPPARYKGAHCRSARSCMSKACVAGRCKGKEEVENGGSGTDADKNDKKNLEFESLWCATQAQSVSSVERLPEWLLEDEYTLAAFAPLEQRFEEFSGCVNDWKSKMNLPGKLAQEGCRKCHPPRDDAQLFKLHLALLSRIPGGCRTVCQTGFARGDSALILSAACGPGTNVLSFSEDTRWYTRPGIKCLGDHLKDHNSTVTFIEGISANSIEKFLDENSELGKEIKCDVVHVDGCQEGKCRVEDLYLLLHTTHDRTVFIADDLTTKCGSKGPCKSSWEPNSHRCLFEAVSGAMSHSSVEMRCFNYRQKQGEEETAVCYGYRDWNELLGDDGTESQLSFDENVGDSSSDPDAMSAEDALKLGDASDARPKSDAWKKFWKDKACKQDLKSLDYDSEWVKDQPSVFQLTFDHSDGKNLGVDVAVGDGKYLLVNGLFNGVVDSWNKKNPKDAVKVQDRIVEINGIRKVTKMAKECTMNKKLTMTFNRVYKDYEGAVEVHLTYRDSPQCKDVANSWRVNRVSKTGGCKPVYEFDATFARASECALAALNVPQCSKGIFMYVDGSGKCHCCDSASVVFARNAQRVEDCKDLVDPFRAKCLMLAGQIEVYQIEKLPGTTVRAPLATEKPQGSEKEQEPRLPKEGKHDDAANAKDDAKKAEKEDAEAQAARRADEREKKARLDKEAKAAAEEAKKEEREAAKRGGGVSADEDTQENEGDADATITSTSSSETQEEEGEADSGEDEQSNQKSGGFTI